MIRALHVLRRVVAVDQHEDQVESAEQTRLDARVRVDVKLRVPLLPRADGIRCGNDCRPGVNLAHDASFGN